MPRRCPVRKDIAVVFLAGPDFRLLIVGADGVAVEGGKRLTDSVRRQRKLATFNGVASAAATATFIFGVGDRIEFGPESFLDEIAAAEICRLNFILGIVEADYI